MNSNKKGFGALCFADSEILVLGSLPSDTSLAKGQYYGHKRNLFWKIAFEVFGETPSDDYAVRLSMLEMHKVALWDVLASAERLGSLDSAIKNACVNDVRSLCKSHPTLKRIVLNGKAAQNYFERFFSDMPLEIVRAPSTSPIVGKYILPYEQKLTLWRDALTLPEKI